MTAIRLHSPLAPRALAERLRAALPETMTSGSPAQVTGYGTDARMTLWSHRPNFNNSFKSVLSATITPHGDGSLIDGRLGMHFAARMFLMFWMGLVALFGLFAGGTMFAVGIPLAAAVPMVAIPGGMFAFALLLLFVGRRTAREDEAKIMAFLAMSINAQPYRGAGVEPA